MQEAINIGHYVSKGLMPDCRGKTVLDIGCGYGSHAIALSSLGASAVIAADIQDNRDIFREITKQYPNIHYIVGDTKDTFRRISQDLRKNVDIIFMHLMSEHVFDLRGFLRDLADEVQSGTEVFMLHDNFYSPMGHHDHGFLNLDPQTWKVEPQTEPCWASPAKCDATSAARLAMGPLWSARSDATRDPANCGNCNFFKRSQPWSHLLYANEMTRVFPEPFFLNELNRLTVQQVLWLLEESGFDVSKWERSWIGNDIPPQIASDFARHDLLTFNCAIRAERA